ncbi:MAG: sulfatase-like hydrolase/transferase [Euryarchaeota archaeon]|nr:sulfatase-like hydrolase/transferase [Euryarchaeota archaeon]
MYIYKIVCICLIIIIIPSALAQTHIDAGKTNPPSNIILLIIDGMGSKYISPNCIPTALDGTPVSHADVPIMYEMISHGVLIPDIQVPVPSTDPAHSVIITGYSGADQETVELPDATIYDVLNNEGFLSIAIMHKGDFTQLRNKQDIILYTESNSIKEPSLSLQINDNNIPDDIVKELKYWELKFSSYQKETKGIESYTAYADWEINASKHLVSLMAKKHPEMRYILTINIGIADCAGHYRGIEGYITSIEALDKHLEPLVQVAHDSNTALIITADHGMAFRSANATRGGHASDDFYCSESVTVPLIMVSPNIITGVIDKNFNQQDIAPTILSILDVPQQLQYSNGNILPVKQYTNLWISSDIEADVKIIQEEKRILNSTGDSQYFFSGLKPGNNYIVRVSKNDEIFEEAVKMDIDRHIEFNINIPDNIEQKLDHELWRKRIASAMIILVIVVGLLVIRRIKD